MGGSFTSLNLLRLLETVMERRRCLSATDESFSSSLRAHENEATFMPLFASTHELWSCGSTVNNYVKHSIT